jgi:hypothetical protein
MRRKISWTDGRTDKGKTVYPPPPLGSRGIIIKILVVVPQIIDGIPTPPPGIFSWKSLNMIWYIINSYSIRVRGYIRIPETC